MTVVYGSLKFSELRIYISIVSRNNLFIIIFFLLFIQCLKRASIVVPTELLNMGFYSKA